jgi:hypothetical protein
MIFNIQEIVFSLVDNCISRNFPVLNIIAEGQFVRRELKLFELIGG